jgi:hypothetical protein
MSNTQKNHTSNNYKNSSYSQDKKGYTEDKPTPVPASSVYASKPTPAPKPVVYVSKPATIVVAASSPYPVHAQVKNNYPASTPSTVRYINSSKNDDEDDNDEDEKDEEEDEDEEDNENDNKDEEDNENDNKDEKDEEYNENDNKDEKDEEEDEDDSEALVVYEPKTTPKPVDTYAPKPIPVDSYTGKPTSVDSYDSKLIPVPEPKATESYSKSEHIHHKKHAGNHHH